MGGIQTAERTLAGVRGGANDASAQCVEDVEFFVVGGWVVIVAPWEGHVGIGIEDAGRAGWMEKSAGGRGARNKTHPFNRLFAEIAKRFAARFPSDTVSPDGKICFWFVARRVCFFCRRR